MIQIIRIFLVNQIKSPVLMKECLEVISKICYIYTFKKQAVNHLLKQKNIRILVFNKKHEKDQQLIHLIVLYYQIIINHKL